MADYVGAVAAIKVRLLANWSTTPIAYANELPANEVDGNGNPQPWVFLEIISSGSDVIGSGTPGSQTILYEGLIKCHVFVPATTGIETGLTHAVALGEIFKNQVFYNDTPGIYVRTLYPRIDDATAASEDGNWFAVTATTPFQYFHRG